MPNWYRRCRRGRHKGVWELVYVNDRGSTRSYCVGCGKRVQLDPQGKWIRWEMLERPDWRRSNA